MPPNLKWMSGSSQSLNVILFRLTRKDETFFLSNSERWCMSCRKYGTKKKSWVPEESLCRSLDFSLRWKAIELISILITIQQSYPFSDQSINWFISLWFWFSEKNLIVWSILFLSFHFIWLIIVIFVNCLTVAKKVIGRTHTLNGTTVEVSCLSIIDEFQAKGGSENQVRPTV